MATELIFIIEISRIHHEYSLEQHTRYNTPVKSIRRAQRSGKPSNSEQGNDWNPAESKWIVNDGEDGEFDAVIVTVGTCGEPNMVKMKGMPGWKDEKKSTHEEKIERSKSPDGASAKANSVASERDRISFGGI